MATGSTFPCRERWMRRRFTSPQPDKADANAIATGRIRPRRQGQAAQQPGADGGNGRRLHEVTARGAFIQIRSHVSPSRGGMRAESRKLECGERKRRGRQSSLQPYSFSKSFDKGSRFSRSRSAWSATRSGRTTRKPTCFASVKYQMLCGICGS